MSFLGENEKHGKFYSVHADIMNRNSGQNERKRRKCLKCGVVFISASFGNRCCGSCAAQNKRASVRASGDNRYDCTKD